MKANTNLLDYWEAWLTWWTITLCPIPQEIPWPHPCKIVLDEPGYILYRFFPDDGRDNAPFASLLAAPEAGHTGNCMALSEEQSIVRMVHDNTIGAVYLKVSKDATMDRKNEGFDEFVDGIRQCVKKIGKPTIGIGVCQGGYPSLITEALYPGTFAGLMLVNSPVDFKIDGGPIQKALDTYGYGFYEYMVACGYGLMDGRWLVAGFIAMSWQKRIEDDGPKLFEMILRKEAGKLAKYEDFRRWYYKTQCLPGRQYLQTVKDLFFENLLIKGEFAVHGRRVNLADVRCPLSVIYSEKDQITLPRQATEVIHYVSSPQKAVFASPGGHFSFASGTSLRKYYPPAVAFLRNNFLAN
ncbi:hypothetical protein A2303_00410 [Candidatus Falkowbacteria bacterium RIFOXYB2_FULL_47_14]|uniref:AB hydrolase-1 domain-containing protein n=1 Tax=Candidatus Falkowbacteria bacterium RIFOXYA2_FULL_47_19 TaxID=1797994 RepID=A0A1F5SLU6_9BACT|nr:MAG: hypothetical protein A2227_03815 [Candidatus Falkowbacteria bacterium RIFOXYA2_FULL_47_19]OGF37337.1 MAG: hypothetical protein A2468_02175 [Candidatus Falkowbacteria bacterium RIFOXYC2_FULL_46_15]OGF42839.1 MAG: hypothetical protein A2303_00410 [Candidatus Falkowbacteria bacterium RIFOXYB2_FULL_47_14]